MPRSARSQERLQRLKHPAFFGTLRRTRPISDQWGYDRGTPIDRYYIQQFLAQHRAHIRGSVLEVLDSRYTQEFGGADAESTILDIDASNPRATLVADLSLPETLPDHAYDCFILTQTLQYVYDLRAAVASVHQVLRPGGVALVTVPSLSRIAPSAGVDGDFWRLTAAACKRLFSPLFGDVEVETYGNVLAGTAFLYGVAAEELTQKELSTRDEHYPVLVGVRAGRSA